MYIPVINRADLVQRSKKITKKNQNTAAEFESTSAEELDRKKSTSDINSIEQTLFLLQEFNSKKETDELIEKTKESIQLLNLYRLSILNGAADLEQLQYLINHIKELKKGVLNYNILAILNRVETLASIEAAKASLIIK